MKFQKIEWIVITPLKTVTGWYFSCLWFDRLILILVNSLNWIWPNLDSVVALHVPYIRRLTMYDCIICSPLLCLTLTVWSPLMSKLFTDFRWEVIRQPIRYLHVKHTNGILRLKCDPKSVWHRFYKVHNAYLLLKL